MSNPGFSSKRLLVVDDDQDALDSITAFLEAGLPGLQLESARTPREALGRVRDRPFDIVIADLRMPEMTGADFLRRANEIRPGTYSILMTGYPAALDEPERWPGSHGHSVVLKPIETKPFLDLLERVLGWSPGGPAP